MTVLVIDGQNFLHRARVGPQTDVSVVQNFFRQLKAIVEQFEPSRVYFTREGRPVRQLEAIPEYKANRVIDTSTPKGIERKAIIDRFLAQAIEAVAYLAAWFPVSVMRHPHHEADDLVYSLVANASSAADFVIVSTDTDFIQVLQEFKNVRLYNPTTKSYVSAPEYDYVYWKALRGDATDNVSGLPGVEGDDRLAALLLSDASALERLFSAHGEQFQRNVDAIRLKRFSEAECLDVESSEPTRDWDAVRRAFEARGLSMVVKEPYWSKFVAVFDKLWVT